MRLYKCSKAVPYVQILLYNTKPDIFAHKKGDIQGTTLNVPTHILQFFLIHVVF